MSFLESYNNIYAIDSMMFGYQHYQSCYVVVAGNELILVDAGIPSQLEAFRRGLKKHGFSIQDVSHIFLTHCEHPDHAGNVRTFVKENPKIKVHINPVSLEYLTNPEIEAENRKKVMLPEMAARFGEQIPVPKSNIEFLADGDKFRFGDSVKFEIMFTQAHQPSGLVVFDSANQGLFINDIVGNYFSDVDVNLILTPPRSDVLRAQKDIEKFRQLDLKMLYLGHYGIHTQPKQVLNRASQGIQRILDIGAACVNEGKPEDIERRVLSSRMLDIENLKKGSQHLHEYTKNELITHHSTYFAKYYLERTFK